MKKLMFAILVSLFFIGCFDDGGGSEPVIEEPVIEEPVVEEPEVKTYSGKLEKGAFQQGAEIIAYGWDEVEGFTGESFTTNTTDDLGNYSLTSTKIKDILYVKAEGYFYNENTDTISDSTLKLYGMVDSTKVPWNINVLTHIIQPRVMTLLENGDNYDDAVNQAIGELFAPLNWSIIDPGTQSVANNANLLFFSSAICKNRNVAEVSDILTTLSSDLADGNIDISVLDASFQAVDTAEVEANMTAKYGSSPDIATVKSQVLTYRNLDDITVRIITVQPVESAEFYIINGSSLKGFINNSIKNINIEYIQTYGGVTQTLNSTINNFFSITEGGIKTLYFSITVPEDKDYLFSQTSGILTEIETLPDKPSISNFEPFENTYYRLSWNNDAHTTQLLYSIIGGQNTGSGFLQRYIETTDYIKDGVNLGDGVFSQWSQGSNNIRWLSRDSYLIYDVAFGTIW